MNHQFTTPPPSAGQDTNAQQAAQAAESTSPPQHTGCGTKAAPGANWCHLPQELRDRPQWCVAGPDKAPLTINLDTGEWRNASVTTPSDWMTFADATSAAERLGYHIGYVLSVDDPFVCIDLDVKDDTPAKVRDRFKAIVEQFDSYTEYSRSGKGAHIWIKGKLRKGYKRDDIEVYPHARFIISTGMAFANKPIAERQLILDRMVSQMPTAELAELQEREAVEEDQPVLDKALKSSKKIARLFRDGNWQAEGYPSQSEADLAAMGILCACTSSNEQVRRIFRQSPLGQRDKAVKDNRYLNLTLKQIRSRQAAEEPSIRHGKEMAEAILRKRPDATSSLFTVLRDDDLSSLPLQPYIVKRLIDQRTVGSLFGPSGTYKSFLVLDLLAHIAHGQEWFGHRVKQAPTVYVPFEGRGGIPKRVAAWRLAKTTSGQPLVKSGIAFITEAMNLRLPDDRDKLVATMIERNLTGGVLCIDTLAHASQGIDENSSEMSVMLTIFNDIAIRANCAVLVVHHTGKDETRGMRGWSGLLGAFDFVIECLRPDPKERKDKFDARFGTEKVKDDERGKLFDFRMQRIHLGPDEDGDEITSLAVTIPQVQPVEAPTVPVADAVLDAQDDEFILRWVLQENEEKRYPSKNSLKGQLNDMKTQREITQARVRDAIERLMACTRLVKGTGKSPSGNEWILAVPEAGE